MAWIDDLFHRMLADGASDLHLTSGETPKFRVDGDVVAVQGAPALNPEQMQQVLFEIAPERNRQEFTADNDTDFAYELPGGAARFRANLFRDRKGPGGVFRVIPSEILTAEQLGLPPAVLELCRLSKGLVVVTVEPLGHASLMEILTTPRNAIARQFQHLFALDDVELVFTQDAISIAAALALKHKTGARGLRSIIEEALLDVMYEIPSNKEIKKCIISGAVIRGEAAPELYDEQGRPVGFGLHKAA